MDDFEYNAAVFRVDEICSSFLFGAFEAQLGALTGVEKELLKGIIAEYEIDREDLLIFSDALKQGHDCEKVFPGYKELVEAFLSFCNQRSYAVSVPEDNGLSQTIQLVKGVLDQTEILGMPAIDDDGDTVEEIDATVEMFPVLDEEVLEGTAVMGEKDMKAVQAASGGDKLGAAALNHRQVAQTLGALLRKDDSVVREENLGGGNRRASVVQKVIIQPHKPKKPGVFKWFFDRLRGKNS